MNKIEKPAFLTSADWQLLKEKYPNNIEEILEKLENHYPVQYLIGDVNFYGYPIKVDENCLIPRFETELFVEKIIQKIKKLNLLNPKVIDLGTGSGCIAIAIKKEIKCEMTSLDISEKALDIAKKNAKNNKVTIHFIEEDMSKISLENYDVVISNPPYVKKDEFVGPETKFEPQNALFAEENGIYFYHQILKNTSKVKNKPVMIAFEIGMTQGNQIKDLAQKYLPKYQFQLEQDYQKRDRYVFLIKNKD